MNYSEEHIGEMIRQERKKRNWTLDDLAGELHMSTKQVSKFEVGYLKDGKRHLQLPSLGILQDLCRIFDCELGYLIGDDGYTERTRSDTDVVEATGLSVDSIHVIQSLTGVIDGESNCMRLRAKYESDKTRNILNGLLTSDLFIKLFSSIFDLETRINDTKGMFQDVIDEVGIDKFNEVLGLYTSSVGYMYDPKAPKLTDEQIYIWNLIEKAIDENKNEEEKGTAIRYQRYEVAELFNELIYEMYPRQHNETIEFNRKQKKKPPTPVKVQEA